MKSLIDFTEVVSLELVNITMINFWTPTYSNFIVYQGLETNFIITNFYAINSFFSGSLIWIIPNEIANLTFACTNFSLVFWNPNEAQISNQYILNFNSNSKMTFFQSCNFFNIFNSIVFFLKGFPLSISDSKVINSSTIIMDVGQNPINISLNNSFFYGVLPSYSLSQYGSSILIHFLGWLYYSSFVSVENCTFNNFGYTVFFFVNLTAIISNCTLINLYSSTAYGGLVGTVGQSLLSLQNIILQNVSTMKGSLMYSSEDDDIAQIDNIKADQIYTENAFIMFTFLSATNLFIKNISAHQDTILYCYANCLISLSNSSFENVFVETWASFLATMSGNNTIFLNNVVFFNFTSSLLCIFLLQQNNMLTLSNCSFNNATILSIGGVIASYENCVITIFNCSFFITQIYGGFLSAVFVGFNKNNITIDNSLFIGLNIPNGSGGLIAVFEASFVSISRTILKNASIEGSGGISISYENNFIFIEQSYFQDIQSNDMGAIFSSGGDILNFTNITIKNIYSVFGACLCATGPLSIMFSNSYIENSSSLLEGSVVWLTKGESDSVGGQEITYSFLNNHFINCTSMHGKGLVFILRSNNDSFELSNNVIMNSYALMGGIIFASNFSYFQIENNIFFNITDEYEGALHLNGQTVFLLNCTFFMVESSTSDAGALLALTTDLTILNSNFMNIQTLDGDGSVLWANSNIDGQENFINISGCNFTSLNHSSASFMISSKMILVHLTFSNCIFWKNQASLGVALISCTNCNVFLSNMNIFFNEGAGFFEFYNLTQMMMENIDFTENSILNDYIFEILQSNATVLIENFLVYKNIFSPASGFLNVVSSNIINFSNIKIQDNVCSSNGNSFEYILNTLNNISEIYFFKIEILRSNFTLMYIVAVNKMTLIQVSYLNCSSSENYFLFISCNTLNISEFYLENVQFSSIHINSNISCGIRSGYFLNVVTQSVVNFLGEDSLNNINFTLQNFTINHCEILFLFQLYSLISFSQNNFISLFYSNGINRSFLSFTINGQIIFYGNNFSNLQNQRAVFMISTGLLLFLSNFDRITNSGDVSLNAGGIYAVGNIVLILNNTLFNQTMGNPIFDMFLFSNNSKNTDLVLQNVSFSTLNQSSMGLFLENETLLEKIIQENLQIVSLSSYTKNIIGFLSSSTNKSEINISDFQNSFTFSSGDFFDLLVQSFDFMGMLSYDLTSASLNINQSNGVIIRNNKTFFVNGQAQFSNLQLVLNNGSTNQYIQISLNISNTINDEFTSFTKIYFFNFTIQLIKCSIGQRNISNICTPCPNNTFSFQNNPGLNDDNCIPCPTNADCLNGVSIIPKEGYWNFDSSTNIIIKCEIYESCLGNGNYCLQGYYGISCYDCEEGYGMLPSGKCEKCDNKLVWVLYFFKSFLNILFVTLFLIYENKLLTEKNEELLLVLRIFEEHILINSLFFQFSFLFSERLEIFYELQNVFSFFDFNLFYLNCLFNGNGSSLYTMEIIYYHLIPLSVFIISLLISYCLKRLIYFEINCIHSFLLLEKFSTLLVYFFFGSIIILDINSSNAVPILYRNMLSSSETYFSLFIPIYFFMILCIICMLIALIYRLKANSLFVTYIFGGFSHKKILFFSLRYITRLLLIIFSLNSSQQEGLFFLMIYYFIGYLSIFVKVKPYKNGTAHILQGLSFVNIIISFVVFRFELDGILIIVGNTIFLFGIGLKIFKLRFKTKGKKI